MKKAKIIIPVILVIVIAAVVAGVVLFGNKIAISGKSKISMGLEKTMKTFEVSDGLKEKMGGYEYLNNIDTKPFEAEVKMSADANINNLEDLVGDKELAKTIKKVIKEVSNADITTKISYDKKEEKAMVNLNLNAKDIIGEISGEAVITPDQVAFRSKDLNEEYLVLNKDDSEDLEEFFDVIQQLFDMNYKGFKFTDEEIKHFKDTYGSILSDFIEDDMLKSEKSDFKVDGSKKSCDKETLTLKNDDIKELLIKYIETYESDKKGKEILDDKFKNMYGDLYEDQLKDQLEEAIDEIQDEIDEIEDAKIEFITYGSLFDVYGTEIIITVDGETAKITETFNKNDTNIKIKVEKEEIANISIKKSNKDIKISGTIGIDDSFVELNIAISDTKIDIKADLKEEDSIGNVTITLDLNNKKDTAKEFEQDANLKVALDIPDIVTGDFSLKLSEKIKIVDSIKLPDLSEAISITDQENLSKYATDCQKSLEKYAKKLQESEIINLINVVSKFNSNDSFIVENEEDEEEAEFEEENEDSEDEEDDELTIR